MHPSADTDLIEQRNEKKKMRFPGSFISPLRAEFSCHMRVGTFVSEKDSQNIRPQINRLFG